MNKVLKRVGVASVAILLVLATLIHLVACSKPKQEADPPAPTEQEKPITEVAAGISLADIVVRLAQKQPLVGKASAASGVIVADQLESYGAAYSANKQDGLISYNSGAFSVVYDTNADEYGVVDTVTVNDTISFERQYYDNSGELSLFSVYADYYEAEVDYDTSGRVSALYYYGRYYVYHYNENGTLKDVYRDGALHKSFAYNANGNLVEERCVDEAAPYTRTYAYTGSGALYSVDGVTVRSDGGLSGVAGHFTYGYDFYAQRYLTAKKVNDVETTYKYVGDKVVEISRGGSTVSYMLDKDLNYVGLCFEQEKYYFAVDPFGNVMALVDSDGNFVVEYQCDAWGNVIRVSGALADTLGHLNEIINLNGLYDHDLKRYYFAQDVYSPTDGVTLRAGSFACAKTMYEWEQSNYFARSAVSAFARIHDMVVEVAVKNLKEKGLDVTSNLYVSDANGDSKRLVDIYTLSYEVVPFSSMNLLNGNQVYEVIYHAPDSEKFYDIAHNKLQGITEKNGWSVSYFANYPPAAGTMKFNGQFIFLGYLIDYKCLGGGVVEYQVKHNVKENYDQSVNIYDYDNGKYICYVDNTFDLNFLDGVTIILGINQEQYEALDGYLSDYLQSVAGNICDQMLIYDDPNYYDLENMNVTPDYWAQMNLESTTQYVEIQSGGILAVKTMPTAETDEFATKMMIGAGVVLVTAVVATVALMIPGANCVVVSICVGAAKGAAIGAVTGFAMGFVEEGVVTTVEGLRTGNWNYDFDRALSSAADGFASGAITGAVLGGISGGLNPKYCFEAGTPIATANGAVAIENIAVGDMVWSYDYKTGEKSLKLVTATTVRETNQVISVEIGGEQIVTTPEHPFYVVNNDKYDGYIAAKYLSVGDCIQTADGGYLEITAIEQQTLDEPTTVYNFTVDDNHSYYVGENRLLVHNANGCTNSKYQFKNEQKLRDHAKHMESVGIDPSDADALYKYQKKASDFIEISEKSVDIQLTKGYGEQNFAKHISELKRKGKDKIIVSVLRESDGATVYYDAVSNQIAVLSKTGKINTYWGRNDYVKSPLHYVYEQLYWGRGI